MGQAEDAVYVIKVISGFCALWATALSLNLVYKHARNYTIPKLQRPIMRIILMIPIYAIASFLALMFRHQALYFDFVRDCYESYVIYQFFLLLINYFDGEESLIRILRSKPKMGHPSPFCFLPKFPVGQKFLRICKLCVLQFAFFKPLLTAIAIPMMLTGVFHEGEFIPNGGYLWITMLYNISITVSMYFLLLFFMAIKDNIAPLRPVPKFFAIKTIIFFSFWQGVAISGLKFFHVFNSIAADLSGQTAEKDPALVEATVAAITVGLQDALICVEMFIISIIHIKVFGYDDYRNPNKEAFLRSIIAGRFREAASPIITSIRDAMHPKHDIDATRVTIAPFVEDVQNSKFVTAIKKWDLPLDSFPGSSFMETTKTSSSPKPDVVIEVESEEKFDDHDFEDVTESDSLIEK
eukprot:TRINITY_DN1583_c0_g2_i5.p1 TRINITY_DN1583_c0_g2~~TRINITY_DN1583_c0_g2_i5.p1  ORF type:complete len:409 (+),score=84.35 TRINITY_DN1583_c0_g2_i5:987-2213(+)